jgi:hypothetical protein
LKILSDLKPNQVAREFAKHSADLQETFLESVISRLFVPMLDAVSQRLEPLPRVPIGADSSCQDAWSNIRDEDKVWEKWCPAIPSFQSQEIANWLTSSNFGTEEVSQIYTAVMQQKVDATLYQVSHEFRIRILTRLGGLVTRLEELGAATTISSTTPTGLKP